jgi:hypothetical protein
MNRRTLIKAMLGLGTVGALLNLSACGEQLIRPDDKQVLAMLQFEMPDYEPTNESVLKKVQQWMNNQANKGEDTLTFVSAKDNALKAKGIVSIHIKNKVLKVAFIADISVVNANLIRFNASHFRDLPGQLEGESDKAAVFYDQVKDQVLTLCDRLENYLGEDVASPLANFQKKDLI